MDNFFGHCRKEIGRSNHLIFCLIFIFSMDFHSTWSKVFYMTRHLSFNCQGVTWPWRSYKIFSSKHKHFGAIRKIISFWPSFKKEIEINYDITRRYSASKHVQLVGENVKSKLFGPIQQIITVLLEHLCVV